jgi:hypothetical protein
LEKVKIISKILFSAEKYRIFQNNIKIDIFQIFQTLNIQELLALKGIIK